MAPGGASTRTILARMAETAPVISSTVSPRTRSAISSPPICDGVASPDIMLSKAAAASSRVSCAPVATWPMSALSSNISMGLCGPPRCREPAGGGIPLRGYVEKILQDQVAVLGGDTLGVELHAVNRVAAVVHPHDQ